MQESIIEEKLRAFVKSTIPQTKSEIVSWYSDYLILFYLISIYKENSGSLGELSRLVRFRNIMEHEFPKVNCIVKMNNAKDRIEKELPYILKEVNKIWRYIKYWE